tara:strand:- start:115 stop:1443 length:1329 start_codon:yes stop_codon:yes gene_type:complete
MAVNKTGISRLFQASPNINSSIGGDVNEASQIGKFIVARVVDINLNSNSNLFKKTGEWSGIGTINFAEAKTPGNTSVDNATLQLATPLFPNLKNYPLVNEYVLIVKGPSNENPDVGSKLKNFYVSITSLWNNQHINAVPISLNTNSDVSPSLNKSYTSIEAGNVGRPTTQKQSIDLNGNSGGTFEEKGDIHPILPFAGDNVFEGRFGNSIRLGNTSKAGGIITNNWSAGNNTENGDPITIIKNGQPSSGSSEGYLPITEDINNDPTSIYLTSTQKIPFDIAVASTKEGEGSTIPYSNIITPVPKSPKSFNNPQVILNSGRLLFNTHTDSILFSSQKSIVLTSIEDLGIQSQTKNVNIISDKGVVSLGKQNASESVILGDTFIDDFTALIDNLKTLCSALGKEGSLPIASSLANILSQSGGVLDNISNRSQAGDYKSKKVKTT